MRTPSVFPIVATAEDIATGGPLVAELTNELPDGSTVHDKMVFGLAGQPSIVNDVRRTGRGEFVVVGMEADVCVTHSAIGLMELGYRVAVIDDAGHAVSHSLRVVRDAAARAEPVAGW